MYLLIDDPSFMWKCRSFQPLQYNAFKLFAPNEMLQYQKETNRSEKALISIPFLLFLQRLIEISKREIHALRTFKRVFSHVTITDSINIMNPKYILQLSLLIPG